MHRVYPFFFGIFLSIAHRIQSTFLYQRTNGFFFLFLKYQIEIFYFFFFVGTLAVEVRERKVTDTTKCRRECIYTGNAVLHTQRIKREKKTKKIK